MSEHGSLIGSEPPGLPSTPSEARLSATLSSSSGDDVGKRDASPQKTPFAAAASFKGTRAGSPLKDTALRSSSPKKALRTFQAAAKAIQAGLKQAQLAQMPAAKEHQNLMDQAVKMDQKRAGVVFWLLTRKLPPEKKVFVMAGKASPKCRAACHFTVPKQLYPDLIVNVVLSYHTNQAAMLTQRAQAAASIRPASAPACWSAGG